MEEKHLSCVKHCLPELKTDYYLKGKIATKMKIQKPSEIHKQISNGLSANYGSPRSRLYFWCILCIIYIYQCTNIGSWMLKVHCEWKISKCPVATKWEIMQHLFKYLLIRICTCACGRYDYIYICKCVCGFGWKWIRKWKAS